MISYGTSTFAVLLFAIPLTVVWLYQRLASRHGISRQIPWADGSTSMWSVGILHIRSLFSLKTSIENGYYTYSKADETFLLPNIATGPEVILPMSQMKWLLEQPDDVLNQNEVNREFLNADRTMLHQNIVHGMVHGRVIRREMTKLVDTYANEVADEIDFALELNWGTDTADWKEVRLYDTMLDVIARISNRVLVGLPLCRDTEYLASSMTYSRSVVITAGILNMLPGFMEPFLAPLVMAYDKYHYRKIARKTIPTIAARAKLMKPGVDYHSPDYSQHNDYLQWALHDAFSHDVMIEREPEMIAKRLTVLGFAAIQSSVITITNCIFDIASSSDCDQIQTALKKEVAQVTQRFSDTKWHRKSLSAMIRLDSVLRESMRLWGFISRGVMKKVVAPKGITLPTGQHLPRGSKVGVTSYGVHHDESAYKNATSFDPFRFCAGEDAITGTSAGAQAMITTADNFMAFSHGRHACPGRFFAANQLKILLAAIVTQYEVEPILSRPINPWLNNTIGPPIWDTVRVRRRQ